MKIRALPPGSLAVLMIGKLCLRQTRPATPPAPLPVLTLP
jgi:hypothetical protein